MGFSLDASAFICLSVVSCTLRISMLSLCHVFRMCLGTEAGQKGKGHKAQ
ncbi:hypothetical protein NXU92_22390 (plasmid) [Bacteroides fragilis]|nr:hypothetical protein [Bacteroides fragilis]